tara:strand:+ start:2156 stop:3961 length:1806 start_codon:yes stop_codon:yes gene_type:complete
MAHLFRLPEDANFGAVGGDAHTPKSTKEADAHCTALLVALLEATVNQPIKPKPGGTQKKLGFKPASKPSGGPMAGNRIAVEGRAVNAASRGTGGGDAGGGGGGDGGDGIQIFGEIHVVPPVREESTWQCFECQHENKPHYQFCEHCYVGLPPKAMTDVNRVNGSVETGDGVLDTSGGGVDADSFECIVITDDDDDDDLDRNKETVTSPVRGHMIIVSEDDAESEDDDEDSEDDADMDGNAPDPEDVDYFAVASYPRQPVEALDLEEVEETLTQMRMKYNVELKELGSAVDFVWRVRGHLRCTTWWKPAEDKLLRERFERMEEGTADSLVESFFGGCGEGVKRVQRVAIVANGTPRTRMAIRYRMLALGLTFRGGVGVWAANEEQELRRRYEERLPTTSANSLVESFFAGCAEGVQRVAIVANGTPRSRLAIKNKLYALGLIFGGRGPGSRGPYTGLPTEEKLWSANEIQEIRRRYEERLPTTSANSLVESFFAGCAEGVQRVAIVEGATPRSRAAIKSRIHILRLTFKGANKGRARSWWTEEEVTALRAWCAKMKTNTTWMDYIDTLFVGGGETVLFHKDGHPRNRAAIKAKIQNLKIHHP